VTRLRAAVAFTLLAAAQALPATPSLGQADDRPNVLLIVTDDQHATGTLTTMKATRRLFLRDGTMFTNAYATTPRCCPSRASIFTGQYAHNHGVRRNSEAELLDQSRTLQRYLSDAGYRTALFGKFLNGWSLSDPPPYFETFAIKNSSRYYDAVWNVNGLLQFIETYATRYMGQLARRFMADAEVNDDQPWFMVLSTTAPHAPRTVEERYRGSFVSAYDFNPAVREWDRSDKPDYVQAMSSTDDYINLVRKGQIRTLRSVDDMIESVFDKAGELEEARNTLAIFVSDNGLMWGEHGIGGDRTGKNVPYLDSVKVPLLLRWPGNVAGGPEDMRLAATIDIFPTIMDAAGVESQHPVDGRSLLGPTRTRLLLENWHDLRPNVPEWASILTSAYHYIEYYEIGDPRPTLREYYDLTTDPWELVNLLGDGTATNDPDVTDLSVELAADRACAGSGCP
jgi:arylsulfatase A-like enzyme